MTSCCPSGYTYDIAANLCRSIIKLSDSVAPTVCPCCPPGYVYVDQNGYFDTYTPAGRVLISNVPTTPFEGLCVTIVNGTYALLPSPVQNTISCPCCPDGFFYNSVIGDCDNGKEETPTIPCIPCVCLPPVDPPPCETCTQSQGVHISFNFNDTIKACKDCTSLGDQVGLSTGADAFIPIQLLDPITISFFLRS